MSECLYMHVFKYESCECAHTRAGWSQEREGGLVRNVVKVSLAAEARSRGVWWRDWGEFWQPGLGMHREAWDALKDHHIASPTPPQVI